MSLVEFVKTKDIPAQRLYQWRSTLREQSGSKHAPVWFKAKCKLVHMRLTRSASFVKYFVLPWLCADENVVAAQILHIVGVYKGLVDLEGFRISAHGPMYPGDKPTQPRSVVVTGKGLRTASSNKEQGLWLVRLVNYISSKVGGPITVLELGTCVGISGMYILTALERNYGGELITFEGSEKLAEIAESNFESLVRTYEFNKTSYSVQIGGIDTTLSEFLSKRNDQLHLAFVDGNHQESSTVMYHKSIRLKMHHQSIIVHDDISWGSEMVRAWESIRALEGSAQVGELHLGGIPSRGIIFIGMGRSDEVDIVNLDGKIERTARKVKRCVFRRT